MERPILFNGEMVNAILAGRKTQTRRVIKVSIPDNFVAWHGCNSGFQAWTDNPRHGEKGNIINMQCPYGASGETLWVRETFTVRIIDGERFVFFRADCGSDGDGAKWKPSIFMQREYSRINLKITDVRVEQLQEMRREDAEAEGIGDSPLWRPAFKELWNSINDKRGYGWDSNPWVWVIEFEKI